MTTFPIYDESRGEFVEATSKSSPADRPKRMAAPTALKRNPGETPYLPIEAPEQRVDFFLQSLERMKRAFEQQGNTGDAAVLGEIAKYLILHRAEAETAESDVKPIYAVAAAYIAALTTITSSDEATAAQSLARKLVSLGYELPKGGGDTRGWKRLLVWRDRLERRQLPVALTDVYKRALVFARQDLTHLNVNAALDHALPRERPQWSDPAA